MWYYPISGLLNGFTLTVLGLFVFFRNKKALPNITYGIFCIFISLWSYAYFLWQISTASSSAFFWCQILMVGAAFIPASYYHFILTFINKNHDKKKITFVYVAYIAAAFFAILNFTPLMIVDVRPRLRFPFWPTAGPIYKYFLLYFAIYAIYGCYLLLREVKYSSGIRRNQLFYIFVGSLIGYFGGATNFPLWYDIKIYPFGNILSSIYVGLIGYAIVYYRLMDITILAARTLIFIIVYGILLVTPLFIFFSSKTIFLQILSSSKWWLLPISVTFYTILASTAPFIYMYLQRRAEDILLKNQRQYQKALRELSKTMTRIRDLDKLIKAIVSTVVDTVKVPFAAIYLKNEEYNSYQLKHYYPKKERKRFQEFMPLDFFLIKLLYQQQKPLLSEEIPVQHKISLDSGLVVPCFIEENNLLGFLVLGAKRNNQIYTPDDIIVFETLSYSTSLAIENCFFWKEIEDRQRKARLQEMDTFSYSVAHEIDNPMDGIIGNSELLKVLLNKSGLSEEKIKDMEQYLDFIKSNAQRVSSMVEAIQAFGKATTGEYKPIRIHEVVENFTQLYTPEFKIHKIIFTKELPPTPIFVYGEMPQLMQVLVIFANNAIHAMKYSNEKKITLKAAVINQDFIRVAFSDTGYGIAQDKLAAIFAPFVTTKASSEGTGMGLYNARNIVIKHKGKIWAESEGKDKGASLIFELPIAKDIKEEDFKKSKIKF